MILLRSIRFLPDASEQALQRMIKDAEKLNADAIIGVRIAAVMTDR